MSEKIQKKYYITTTLPYVNSDPHIGFALEIIQADIFSRYYRLQGAEVFFNTGTDEHGAKIYREAQKVGKEPQAYVDDYAARFRSLIGPLGLLPDVNFIRTTDSYHVKAAEEFWKLCEKAGDIYKKKYKIKYCVGCELEKTDSELVDGRCPVHPNLELELMDEDNYFFRLSKYSDFLLTLYSRKDFVVPDYRLNEIRSLIREKGLDDFSISRLKSKMPWGVPVPGDDDHVMYVWFDAFINYISAIGWPHDMAKFATWWNETGGVTQFAGKDQVRQQACMWQAMLASVGISPSKQILIHGFIQSGGQKMSKSLGNVISPYDIVEEYGTDGLRYFIAHDISFFEDSDVTKERLKESYNAGLANGIGNLVSRVMKMATSNGVALESKELTQNPVTFAQSEFAVQIKKYEKGFETYNVQESMKAVFEIVSATDTYIQDTKPFSLIKTDREAGAAHIKKLLQRLLLISSLLEPILPSTATTIKDLVINNRMPEKPLFARKD
jgi:methionyl-tRNA synthetase